MEIKIAHARLKTIGVLDSGDTFVRAGVVYLVVSPDDVLNGMMQRDPRAENCWPAVRLDTGALAWFPSSYEVLLCEVEARAVVEHGG